jgi:hypothetical protein
MKGASNRSSLARLELLQGELAVRYREEIQTALFFRWRHHWDGVRACD